MVLWPENSSDIDPLKNPSATALIDQAARAVRVPILIGTLGDGPTDDTVRNVGMVWDPVTGPGACTYAAPACVTVSVRPAMVSVPGLVNWASPT